MKEKLEEYALIAEIISAIAIVLSLIFVGLQVTQGRNATLANTKAIESQVLQSVMNAELNILSHSIEYPYLNQFDLDGSEDSETAGRAVAYFFMMFRAREQAWRQYKAGILDEQTLESYQSVFIAMIAESPLYQLTWRENLLLAPATDPEFVAYINERVAILMSQ